MNAFLLEQQCEIFLQHANKKNNFSFVANKIISVYYQKFSSFQILHLYENVFLTMEEVIQENNFYYVRGKSVFVSGDRFHFGNKKCVNFLTQKEIRIALKKMVYAIKSL